MSLYKSSVHLFTGELADVGLKAGTRGVHERVTPPITVGELKNPYRMNQVP